MRCTSLVVLLLLLPLTRLTAQARSFNITRLDSTETFFVKIQNSIPIKTPGVYFDSLYQTDGRLQQVIRYTNFVSKETAGNTWTIIDIYEYNEKGNVEKTEHWKTDNATRMCKCGSWQSRTKGIWATVRPYPNCSKKEFFCDETGEKIKEKN